jgi:hypothetical protein
MSGARTRQDRDARTIAASAIIYENGETWEDYINRIMQATGETWDEYIERCEEEGYDIDMRGVDDPDPFTEQLMLYPVTHENWIEFFETYFYWIYENFNDCLRYSGSQQRTFDEILQQLTFDDGGFDESFLNRNTTQEELDANVDIYNTFLHNLATCVEQQAFLSGRNKDVLINICRAIFNIIADFRVTGETNEQNNVENPYQHFYSFYSCMIIFLELAMDHHVFYRYMTGNHTGRNRRVSRNHPTYYIGIWIRKSSVWGIGQPQFDHNGIRFLLTNYARELIIYARRNERHLLLFQLNMRRYEPLVGGKSIKNIKSLLPYFPNKSKGKSSHITSFTNKSKSKSSHITSFTTLVIKNKDILRKIGKLFMSKLIEYFKQNTVLVTIKFTNKTIKQYILLAPTQKINYKVKIIDNSRLSKSNKKK